MPGGTVRFYNAREGYGFITRNEPGRDVFVHIRDVERGTLREGADVTFDITISERGPRTVSARVNKD